MDKTGESSETDDLWVRQTDLNTNPHHQSKDTENEHTATREEGPRYRRASFEDVDQAVEPESTIEENDVNDAETVANSGCCQSFSDWIHSNAFLIYCSQALSSWGDRMWSFGVALYLVRFEDGLLRLTSIFGLARTISVLLFGAIVGEWVDRTPRLRATRISLVIQNSSVMICALFLLFFLLCENWLKEQLGGALVILTLGIIIVIGCIADVASVALKICIQKDWVVVVAGGDGVRLSEMNSVIRRIDLLTNILAPFLVGFIMTYLSLEIAAIFLASWNLASMFVEYFQLHRVYKAVPELAVKKMKTSKDENPTSEEYRPINDVANDDINVGDNEEQENGLRQDRTEVRHKRKKGIFGRIFKWFTSTYQGFKTYKSYQVSWAGISLSFLYMTVLGFDAVSNGYGYSQGVSETVLGIFLALGSLMGVFGTVIFPMVRKRIGLERTGIYANFEQVLCLSLCIASVYAPGSSFDLGYKQRSPPPTEEPMYYTDIYDSNGTSIMPNDVGEHSYWSVGLLFAGMILSRTGLWMFDLTVTQLLQENIAENERGVVNGIQSSLNCFMDMLHFVLVIIAPQPETFGVLIFISVMFVAMGGMLYSAFVYRVRGHLFHPEKIIPCKSEVNRRPNGEAV